MPTMSAIVATGNRFIIDWLGAAVALMGLAASYVLHHAI
jgi:hypothetical protein